MIGPEERKRDHFKEHAEEIQHPHENSGSYSEKLSTQQEDVGRHSDATLGLENSPKLSQKENIPAGHV